MAEWWGALTQPQATLASAGVTGISAIIAVVIAIIVFNGKIASLQSAISATERAVNQHLSDMQSLVQQGTGEVKALVEESSGQQDAVLAGMSKQLGGIAGTQALIGDSAKTEPDHVQVAGADVDARERDDISPTRQKVRMTWDEIKNIIEAYASDPQVDGRTRAKYLRFDRRSYEPLIDSLEKDGRFAPDLAESLREAFRLRNSFKNRKSEPTEEELASITSARNRLVHGAAVAEGVS